MRTITATFRQGSRRITTPAGLWQYDYGQVLNIEGLDLPAVFEADFSNDPLRGDSITMIGSDNSVRIPSQYLESGDAVYAFIFLHNGDDDGETEYRIQIPVEKRPARTKEEPDEEEQSVIGQAIAALNTAVERTEALAAEAEDAKDAILDLGVEAETLRPNSQATVEKRVDEETGSVTLVFGIPEGKHGEGGDKGDAGSIFTPHVSDAGVLSWTNNGELENPDPFDVVSAVLAALPLAEEGRF